MKKIASLVLATIVMTAVLTGCGSNGTLGSTRSDSGSGSSSGSGSTYRSSASSGTSGSGVGYPDEYGDAEGRIGDAMHTTWFDYTVNSAYLCDEYEGYEPLEGNEILVADVTIKNTDRETIPMFDTDFQAQWNDDAEDAFAYPITLYLADDEVLDDRMLPGEYDLAVNQSINGLLVYEVPAGNKDFSISYLEIYSDGSEGNVFFVYFSADKR